MKRVTSVLVAILAIAFTQSALAADLPVQAAPPAPVIASSWTGLYLGVNGGWAWTNSNNGNGTLTVNDTVGGALFPPISIASANRNAQSPLLGGQVGYNWQVGSWVFGVEGDIDGAKINASQAIVFPNGTLLGSGGVGSISIKQDWLASVRGRVGY